MDSILSGWSEDSLFMFLKTTCNKEDLFDMGAVGTANQFAKGVTNDLVQVGIESIYDLLKNIVYVNQLPNQQDKKPFHIAS